MVIPNTIRMEVMAEHIHYYEWDRETGKRISSTQEEIPEDLRKENDDIL